MIRCVAIDDEPKALEIIQSHVAKLDYLQIEAVFTDPFKAISYLEANRVDLLFLDIHMPDINGLKFLSHLHYKPLVIFTTAHSEYAIQSYEVEAVDYLLKPFDFSRFLSAVKKAKERVGATVQQDDFFFINTGKQKKRLLYKDLWYVLGEGNYVTYYTTKDKTLVRASITETMALLPRNMFVQIHRSTIISLNWVDKIEDNHVFIQQARLPISAGYREAFFRIINNAS